MEPKVEQIIEAAKEATRKRIEADAKRVSEPLRPLLEHVAKRVSDASFNVDALILETKSREKMRSHFRTEVGEAPWEYISWQRMATARKILASTTKDEIAVWRVSILVGYPDHPNFGSRFRRIVGVQPSAIRAVTSLAEERPQKERTEELTLLSELVEDLGFVQDQLGVEKTLELFQRGLGSMSREFFDVISEKGREEGRRDRRRGVLMAELALAGVELEDAALRVLGLARLGCAWNQASEYGKAEQLLREAEDLLPTIKDGARTAIQTELLLYWGALRSRQRRFKEARAVLRKAIELSRMSTDRLREAVIWCQLALVQLYDGDIPSAQRALRSASSLVDSNPQADSFHQLLIQSQLAYAYAVAGEADKAESFLPRIWQLVAELGPFELRSRLANAIEPELMEIFCDKIPVLREIRREAARSGPTRRRKSSARARRRAKRSCGNTSKAWCRSGSTTAAATA